MKKSMPEDDELFKRIDEVVHYLWDPIGISEIPQARDEYHSYLAAIYSSVKSGNTKEVVETMKRITGENMGLIFDQDKAEKAAEILLEWKRVIDGRS